MSSAIELEKAGYQRCIVNLVDPAHEQIDLLEPCPPRRSGELSLTPAGRLGWYHIAAKHGEDAAYQYMGFEKPEAA